MHEVVRPTTEEQIRDAVQGAAAKGLKVAIAGKGHSMEGALYPDAIALDMLAFNMIVALDDASKIHGAERRDLERYTAISQSSRTSGIFHAGSQRVHAGWFHECECAWLGYASWTGRRVDRLVSHSSRR